MSTADKALISTLVLFSFVALVFEPLYYFGCNWSDVSDSCDGSPYAIVRGAAVLWRIYSKQWDPMFIDIPVWLRVMCAIEVGLFGPLYAVCAFGLWRRSEWLPPVAYLFSGALLYSTIVYFAMEVIELLPGTNLPMVFLINIPWSILPVVLSWRVSVLFKSSMIGKFSKNN
jgi:hypothetical protein